MKQLPIVCVDCIFDPHSLGFKRDNQASTSGDNEMTLYIRVIKECLTLLCRNDAYTNDIVRYVARYVKRSLIAYNYM